LILKDEYIMDSATNQLNFVFASNDGVKLAAGHFGDADKYYFFKIHENGTVEPNGFIENTFKDIDEKDAHGSTQKRQSIISLMGSDLDFVIAHKMSPNFKKINQKTKVCPIVSDLVGIEECLHFLKDYFSNLLLMKTKKGKNESVDIFTIKPD